MVQSSTEKTNFFFPHSGFAPLLLIKCIMWVTQQQWNSYCSYATFRSNKKRPRSTPFCWYVLVKFQSVCTRGLHEI